MKTSKAVLCYSYSEELATITRKDEHLPAGSKIKFLKKNIFTCHGNTFCFLRPKSSRTGLQNDTLQKIGRKGRKEVGERKGWWI